MAGKQVLKVFLGELPPGTTDAAIKALVEAKLRVSQHDSVPCLQMPVRVLANLTAVCRKWELSLANWSRGAQRERQSTLEAFRSVLPVLISDMQTPDLRGIGFVLT